MLEKLDSINWSALHHAYGVASDVPELIRGWLSHDDGVRQKSIYGLFGNIHHQGTIYEASPYALPFLIELWDCEETPDKDSLICLIAAIAGGLGYYEVHAQGEGECISRNVLSKSNETLEDVLQQEQKIAKQVRSVASPHVPRLITELKNKEPEIRLTVAAVLQFYPEHFGISIPAAKQAVAIEKEEDVLEELKFFLRKVENLAV